MGKTYALDIWLSSNPGGNCRKTVGASDWKYVDLSEVDPGVTLQELLTAIEGLVGKDNDLNLEAQFNAGTLRKKDPQGGGS